MNICSRAMFRPSGRNSSAAQMARENKRENMKKQIFYANKTPAADYGCRGMLYVG